MRKAGVVQIGQTFAYVPNSPAAGHKRKADLVGVGLLAIGLGCLQAILERGEREDWFESTFIVSLTVIFAAGILTFLWWVMRPGNKKPAVNLRVITNRNLAAGTLYAFAFGFSLYGGVFVTPSQGCCCCPAGWQRQAFSFWSAFSSTRWTRACSSA